MILPVPNDRLDVCITDLLYLSAIHVFDKIFWTCYLFLPIASRLSGLFTYFHIISRDFFLFPNTFCIQGILLFPVSRHFLFFFCFQSLSAFKWVWQFLLFPDTFTFFLFPHSSGFGIFFCFQALSVLMGLCRFSCFQKLLDCEIFTFLTIQLGPVKGSSGWALS